MVLPALSPTTTLLWTTALILFTTTTAAAALYYLPIMRRKEKTMPGDGTGWSICFCGNSMQYFNDCPRLVQSLLEGAYGVALVRQDSCLRGGASLTSLWQKGNGMGTKFSTPPARRKETGIYDIGAPSVEILLSRQPWDFIVLQDHTQGPARAVSRQESIVTLREKYIPLLCQSQSQSSTVLLLQTFAYKVPGMRETKDLGDSLDVFTDMLVSGYREYQETIELAGFPCRVIPMAEAVRWLYHHRRQDGLWEAMYSWDDFHPSPHATWLQACLIYTVVTGCSPPTYNPLWWDRSRYMQPPTEQPLALPTDAEAEDLRQLACLMGGVTGNDDRRNNTTMIQCAL